MKSEDEVYGKGFELQKEGTMKKFIVCLVVFICMCLTTENVYALSVQVRGGGIVAPTPSGTTTITAEGIDIFIYEGKTVDLFIGGVIVNPFTVTYDTSEKILSSETTGGNFYGIGLRYRFMTGGWGKPYLSFGIFNGTLNQEEVLRENYTLISGATKHSSSFPAIKIGIGTDIPVAERLSIGIELDAYSLSIPSEKLGTAQNKNSPYDKQDLTTHAPPAMPGFTVGIRYHF